ncbi:phosphoribosyltransferase family protein [Runella zeae]|uniref:phosphoribosyltransferase family protein n=1 Tax=Runella zeae TaxID=94255 RepID=UPI000400089E|nr:phosphoribosyltransferase family protein [Runella zeae]
MQQAILTHKQTLQKIKRIAFEIYERNFEEKHIILAGITGEGYEMARLLRSFIEGISQMEVTLMLINLNKEHPHTAPIQFNIDKTMLAGKAIVVVDDVLNTGRTLAYSLAPFLGVALKRLQVAVMVNRGHHSFPISADYVGYSLSTTLSEHIHVKLTGDEIGVYLS